MYHGGPRARDAAAEGALSGIEGVAKDVVAHVESVVMRTCRPRGCEAVAL